MKHKHHDIIVAWAADTTQVVENRPTGGVWNTVTNPVWHEDYEYRLKPQPKPDVVASGLVEYINSNLSDYKTTFRVALPPGSDNLRLTFDGETGKLKSAEVLP